MDLNELQRDKAQLEASLAHWQGKLTEAQDIIRRAQAQAAQAQQQIDVHGGAIEQVNKWLRRMEAGDEKARPVEATGE